ncbi:hypothetical protein GCM10008960_29450 [Deinococcus sedimenti]|uniref:SF3 helicase domain-containing protein n=2 Tax=Deinococcus sedimenti TaxID=1867090 RepID=A0ABQ2S8B5_9DEIO|nr:hypothetical protein GCM10008960_29450 [Deinococcus sedimenti]
MTPTPIEWYRLLHEGLTLGNGQVEFRLKRPSGGGMKSVWMPWPTFPEHPQAFTPEHIPQDQEVYFGMARRRDTSSGARDNCLMTPLHWVDLDLADAPSYTGGLTKDTLLETDPAELREYKATLFADLLTACDRLKLPPRAVVDSGHGLHVYWLRHTSPDDGTETEEVNRALAGALADLGADAKVHDLPRILRLPGGVNLKNPARPLPVDVWLSEADAWAEREALNALTRVKAAPPLSPVKPAPVPAQVGSGAPAERYVNRAVDEECAAVASAGEGGRNDALNRAAFNLGTLVGAGVLDEQHAAQVLTAAGEAAGLEVGEIRDTVRSGLGSGKAKPRDLSGVGQRDARGMAGIDVGTLPAADVIPEAEHWTGEDKADYSDRQVLELLGLDGWPVTAPDTDTAHGYRLVKLAGGDLGYTGKLGGWLAYTGRQWVQGAGRKGDGAGDLLAQQLTQKLSGTMKPEVARLFALRGVLAPVESRKRDSAAMERAAWRHVKAAKSVEGNGRQKAILEAARPLLMIDHTRFEPRPFVLGFQNGVWDAGQWREHRREDYMLTLAPVEYHPDADQSDWLDVLNRMTGGDADLALGLQDVTGYALSGASTHRVLPWAYGPRGTGKSTYTELLGTLLGDMAASLDTKLFTADGARERLGAAVWGKRAVFCAEAGNARLDAELLKTLSGGDRLPVRFLFSEGFTATPRHMLLMVANDAPKVEAYDDALKDRVLALPFVHPLHGAGLPDLLGGRRIEAARQDPASALCRGFTAWAVEGLARFHRTGRLHRSRASASATAQFWADVDPLQEFWADVGREAFALNGMKAGELRALYLAWAEQVGVRPYAMKKWGQACAAVGLENVKRAGGLRFWTLKNPDLFPVDGAAQGAEAGGSGASGATAPISNSFHEKTPIENSPLEELENSSVAPLAPLAPASGEL